ncbi:MULTISPECIES: hypothetical protein [Nitrosomonas]|uniref:hypothetical protein n=1 Tax=Nitrosomonas TaxID=914 RepID=UPI0023F08515|nr:MULTISPECIES: hypothetical protein [Nitrosomonas]
MANPIQYRYFSNSTVFNPNNPFDGSHAPVASMPRWSEVEWAKFPRWNMGTIKNFCDFLCPILIFAAPAL